MKILGISNPTFIGVTVATKAVCTEYFPLNHQANEDLARQQAYNIHRTNPDLVVFGGWSKGYDVIVKELRRQKRTYPVICVYHSTMFHGQTFGDDIYFRQVEAAQKRGELDFIGFVQPQMAEYYQKVREQMSLWVPHHFRQRTRASSLGPKFKIGILGGTTSWFKNGCGSEIVARDYVARNPSCELITSQGYDKSHHQFINFLSAFSLLVHSSHLECYPNVVQEGWSMGIPSIMSQASVGLIRCPLLTEDEKSFLARMTVLSNIDAIELYKMIDKIRRNWDQYSIGVYNLHDKIAVRARSYVDTLFTKLVDGYSTRTYDKAYLKMPFDRPEKLIS